MEAEAAREQAHARESEHARGGRWVGNHQGHATDGGRVYSENNLRLEHSLDHSKVRPF